MSKSDIKSITDNNTFGNILNSFTNNVQNQEEREKMESYAVMFASMSPLAEAIPGLGEVQLLGMVFDLIDPYGYNQALNRKSLDGLLQDQYSTINQMQKSIANCYNSNGSDTSSCTSAGISATDLANFQSYSPNVQNTLLKSVTSWLTPIDPIVKFPDALMCTTSTNPDQMKDCKNVQYQGYYMDFWNKNVAQYQADAQAAEQAAAEQAAAGLSGDTDQDSRNNANKRKIQLMLSLIFLIAVVVVFLITKSLIGKK